MIYDPVDIRIQSQTNVRSEESGGVVLWKGGGGGSGHTDPHPESATEVENNERFSRSVESATKLVETLFTKKKFLKA